MSLFHLHARLLEGSLENLRRDELQITDSDDWNEINDLARELVAHGFTVWIYDHGHKTPLPGASDYRVVARLHPHRHAGTHLLNKSSSRLGLADLDPRRVQPGPPRRWARRIPHRPAQP